MMLKQATLFLLITLHLFAAGPVIGHRTSVIVNGQQPVTDHQPAFAFEDHLIVPVRIHLLRAKGATAADCKLSQREAVRYFEKAVPIWHQAGIHLVLESVVEEEAENQGSFSFFGDNAPLPAYRRLRPEASRSEQMFHVYYVHAMSVNGVYMDRESIFVKDTAELHLVEGGIDEPLPRVTSHELGHGFGLPHRQDRINLMASGTTGTSLNKQEIETARAVARSFAFTGTPDQLSKLAERALAAGRYREADKLRATLRAIPGR